MDVHAAARHIYWAVLLRDDVAGDCAARPIGVVHAAPRFLRIGAVRGGAVGACHDAGSDTSEFHIDDGCFVGGRMDVESVAVLGQG